MHHSLLKVVLLGLFMFSSISTYGQDSLKQIVSYINRAMLFNLKCPQEKVYLHFDNTGYFKGETMWFKAYVLRADSRQPSDISGVLYVDLLNPSGNVVEHQKLKVVDGEAHGDIRLDSILGTGFYEVRAYTRYMLNFGPSCCFSRVFPIFRKVGRAGDYSHPIIDRRSFRNPLPQREFQKDTVFELTGMNGKERARRGLHVNFYPEGGHMVVGLSSRITFEVMDDGGRHVAADGIVNSSDSLALCNVHTDSLGYGEFEWTASRQPCVLLLTDRETKELHRFDLPEARAEGCVVSIDAVTTDNPMVSIASSRSMQGRLLGYTVMNGGRILMADTLTAESEMGIELSRKLLLPGVNQLTLFSSDGEIQAERLIFLSPLGQSVCDTIHFSVGPLKFSPCGALTVRLQTSPGARFSFSASDATMPLNGPYGTILTYMLLGSELKGYIPHPEYYFESNDERHLRAADRLMLLNGWRRYDWKTMTLSQSFANHLQPIEKGLVISGRLQRAASKLVKSNPIGDVDVSAFLFNRIGQTLDGKNRTDSLGNFRFELPDVEGEWNLQFDTRLKGKSKTYSVTLNRRFRPEPRFVTEEEAQRCALTPPHVLLQDYSGVSATDMADGDSLVSRVGTNEYVIKDVKIKKQKNYWTDYSGGWYNEHDAYRKASLYYDCSDASEAIMDQGEKMPSLYEWLQSQNPLFEDDKSLPLSLLTGIYADAKFGDENLDPSVKTNSTSEVDTKYCFLQNGPGYKGRPTVWILNNKYLGATGLMAMMKGSTDPFEIVISNHEEAPTFLDEVKSVYIVDDYPAAMDTYVRCSRLKGLNPVIIFVYTHPSYTTESSKGRRRTFFEGFNRPSTFQMEDYSVLPPMDDFRRTIYWEPDVKADEAGRATVQFYNNSSARALRISAEGIAPGGRLVVTEE